MEKYVCYYGQKVLLKFKFSSFLKIKEEIIGELKPGQEFAFNITKDRLFTFNYSINGKVKVKKILIKSKMDRVVFELINKKK